MNERPWVSVYIPTHQRRASLVRALDSVFAQTYSNFEIVIVDDGSRDDTRDWLRAFDTDPRVRAFHFDTSRGAQAARNFALAQARHDLVTGLDDDDEWLPERLRMMVDALRSGVGFVAATDIMERDDGTRYLVRRPARITHDMLLRRNVVGNQVLARKADIVACGGFDETLTASQDYDLWIRLSAQAGDGVGIATPLQVIHAQAARARVSTSSRRRHGVCQVWRKYRGRMTPAQRKSHLFNLLRTTGRPITLRIARALWSREDGPRIAAHWLRGHGLLSDAWLERLANLRDRAEIDLALAGHHRRIPEGGTHPWRT
jgi:glycosyltransferase involved in cell wall biosynthesis